MKPWTFNKGLNAAGGLYSSVRDLTIFLKANMGLLKTDLNRSLQETHIKILPTYEGSVAQGWFVENLRNSGKEQIYVNGIISGYTSYMGFNKEKKVGVVILQNSLSMDYEFGEKILDYILLNGK